MLVKIPHNAIASIPLVFRQAGGDIVCAPSKNATVHIDNPDLAHVAITSDAHWIQVTPKLGSGTTSVHYQDFGADLDYSFEIQIERSIPAQVSINPQAMVMEPNPNPPQVSKASKAQNGGTHARPAGPKKRGSVAQEAPAVETTAKRTNKPRANAKGDAAQEAVAKEAVADEPVVKRGRKPGSGKTEAPVRNVKMPRQPRSTKTEPEVRRGKPANAPARTRAPRQASQTAA